MFRSQSQLVKMVQVQTLTLGQKHFILREWMKAIRLSMNDLSEILGVSRSYIHMIMTGQRVPSPGLMERIRKLTMGKVEDLEDLID